MKRFYTLYCGHPAKSSNRLPTCTPVTMPPTMIPPPSPSGKRAFGLRFSEPGFVLFVHLRISFCSFRVYVYVNPCGKCPLSDLSHSLRYPLGPSMLSQMARSHSFSWLSTIPLPVRPTTSGQSSVRAHLGSLHILAVVSHAAVDGGVHVSFWIGGR